MEDTIREDLTYPTHCKKVVRLIQNAFRDGHVVEELPWQNVVLFLKQNKDFYKVLVEVRDIYGVINRCLTAAIQFYNTFYGFLIGISKGKSSLKDNLIQHLIDMREGVLHEIFLDIHNAHDALDLKLCLNILTIYGVGPQALCILLWYWHWISIVVWAGGCFGGPFKVQHRLTKGGPLYPTIFNVVVDAVLCYWVSLVA